MKQFALLALLVAGVSAGSLVRIESLGGGYGGEFIRTLPVDSYSVRAADNYGSALIRNVVPIVSFDNEIRGSLSNSLRYQTGDGISVSDDTRTESGHGGEYLDSYGQLVKSNTLTTKSGSYSYTAPNGQVIKTDWVADANGFRASGAHLPQPVPMPADHAEAHARVLAKVSSASSYGSYDAPAFVRSSYAAPAIRMQSYEAPAPVFIRSSY